MPEAKETAAAKTSKIIRKENNPLYTNSEVHANSKSKGFCRKSRRFEL